MREGQAAPRGEVVFIVRMWSEPNDERSETWRGSIESVASRRRQYFSNIGAMCEFMLAERKESNV